MKFCTKCGTALMDEAVICIKCGCPTYPGMFYLQQKPKPSGLSTAAKVFIYINAFAYMALCWMFNFIFEQPLVGLLMLLPEAWCIPMGEVYSRKIKNGEQVGTGFKVCTLLFVSWIAGILMLCDENN